MAITFFLGRVQGVGVLLLVTEGSGVSGFRFCSGAGVQGLGLGFRGWGYVGV